ncbi:MAG: glycosyl hydrolase family 8 [bacterium]|nr:glycosyl hydrolase family 8 [bacterium]
MIKNKYFAVIFIISFLILPLVALSTVAHGDSRQDILQNSWNNYKSTYITQNGAVLRPDQGNDVVSEGVAYALLRAVWVNDKETFDKVYNFTEKNMSRLNNSSKNDNLIAWRWKDNVIDWGAASDADLDYALALAFASKRWDKPDYNLPGYLAKSIAVQKDILAIETGWVGDKIYLQPGSWYAFKAPIPVNPSYLSPAYYKIFDQISPDPRWNKLVDSAYEIAWKSSRDLDGSVGVGFPADWVQVNDGNVVGKATGLGYDYKYDAFRTSWRFALDYVWFGDQRAKDYLTLSGARNTLLNEWNNGNQITAEYRHDGHPISHYENPGAYGVNIGWFIPENRDIANQFVGKIEQSYNQNNGKFFSEANYYMENWAWLGYALGTNNLPNIYGGNYGDTSNKVASQIILNQLTNPTPRPVATPPSITTPSQSPNPTQSLISQLFQIIAPQDKSTQNNLITFKVVNPIPSNQGTWWSVDSGGWVAMGKTNASGIEWTSDIDVSSWNWNDSKQYTLHAWTKDVTGNQIHSQINFTK